MVGDEDDPVVSLRRALAQAERSRDEAASRLEQFIRAQRAKDREAEHNLSNFLTVIRAITRRTADEAEDLDDYCAVLDGRLSAYMNVHAALATGRSYVGDLASLAAEELLRFTLHEGDRIRIDGPPVRLGADAAGLMVLAFHELISRWVLSGGSDDPASSLHMQWRLADHDGAPSLLLDWTEGAARDDAGSSTWLAWVDQAIRRQLGGETSRRRTAGAWSQHFRLPASAFAAP